MCWNRFGLSQQEIRDRISAYAQGVRHLDALTADFSTKGVGGSYKKMLTYPNIWDMIDADWEKEFKRADYEDTYMMSFWNRRTKDAESFLHDVNFNKEKYFIPSLMVVGHIPDPLLTEDLLMRWLEIAIEAFDADVGEIATSEVLPPRPVPNSKTPQPKNIYPVWRAWLKPGEEWSSVGFLKPDVQTQPYSHGTPWLGGTLYTWPEFAPWDLLNKPSIIARTLSGDENVKVT